MISALLALSRLLDVQEPAVAGLTALSACSGLCPHAAAAAAPLVARSPSTGCSAVLRCRGQRCRGQRCRGHDVRTAELMADNVSAHVYFHMWADAAHTCMRGICCKDRGGGMGSTTKTNWAHALQGVHVHALAN